MMRVEAVRKEDGFLIPMTGAFANINWDRILLEIKIIEPIQHDDYAVLDQLIGLCETKHTNASVEHDAIIYGAERD